MINAKNIIFMLKFLTLILATYTYLFINPAYSAVENDFSSCYNIIDRYDLADQVANRELFVLVDQTIPLDIHLKRSIHKKIHRFIKPGDQITILTFSAFAKDRYPSKKLTGKLDYPLNETIRYHTGITKLKKFDACINKQRRYSKHKIDTVLKSAFEEASTDLPKTELAGSLSRFGESIIAKSASKNKIVLIVSDMLENSDVVSFYKGGKVTPIDYKSAIESLIHADLISNWNEASVYVVGAGLTTGDGYRSEKILRNLQKFWELYFKSSNANLKAWGQPELLTDIH